MRLFEVFTEVGEIMTDSTGIGLNAPEYFGTEVRTVRRTRGLTQQHVATATGYSKAYVSKVEAGVLLPSEKFARGCDRAFAMPGTFERLRSRALQQGHPRWFEPYFRMEPEAERILSHSPELITGILQTPAYAEALIRAALPYDSEELIKSRVAARAQRRELLNRDRPPKLWVVLHEGALRRVVGSRSVMREQLISLVEDAQRPHVTLQLYPFDAATPASCHQFVLLEFRDRSTVLYSDTIMRGQVTDAPDDTAYASTTYDHLRAEALSTAASLIRIREIMKEYA